MADKGVGVCAPNAGAPPADGVRRACLPLLPGLSAYKRQQVRSGCCLVRGLGVSTDERHGTFQRSCGEEMCSLNALLFVV
jgi:hypothetical protein